MRVLANFCCFSVRTGALLLATMGTIWGILLVGIGTNGIIAAETISKDQMVNDNFGDLATSTIIIISIFVFLTGLFTTAINDMVLMAETYEKAAMILPWLILNLIGIVISIINQMIALLVLLFNGDFLSLPFAFVFYVIMTGVSYYVWLCVYSYYVELKEKLFRERLGV